MPNSTTRPDDRGPARHPVTMADVAKQAGVSAMTVSRALRKDGAISDATRQRIMNAVEDLGYVLDQTAGTFASKRSGFVAALVPSLNNSNFADTARGITEALSGSGLQLLLGYTDYSIQKEEQLVESMLMRRPEGVILTGGRHTERARRLLLQVGIPVVETWDVPLEPIEHVVGFSNAEAMRSLVHHVYGQGYSRIGYIGGTSNRDTRGADRRIGYVQAMDDLQLGRGRVVSFGHPPISMQQGGEALVQLLSRWPDTDAAVCVSDLSAFGALSECQRRGWKVPERIALAGFGDFEVSSTAFPRLTTVAVDAFGIGHQSGSLLLRAITSRRDGRSVPAETMLMPFRLIQREST